MSPALRLVRDRDPEAAFRQTDTLSYCLQFNLQNLSDRKYYEAGVAYGTYILPARRAPPCYRSRLVDKFKLNSVPAGRNRVVHMDNE
jgi:hypothetical protein